MYLNNCFESRRGLALTERRDIKVRLQERFPRLLRLRRTGPPAPERTPTLGFTPCGALLSTRFSAHLLHVYAPNEFHVCTKDDMMIYEHV
jgi:hypothetical protein